MAECRSLSPSAERERSSRGFVIERVSNQIRENKAFNPRPVRSTVRPLSATAGYTRRGMETLEIRTRLAGTHFVLAP